MHRCSKAEGGKSGRVVHSGLSGCCSFLSLFFSLFSCESSAVSVGPLRGGATGATGGRLVALWT